MTVLHYIARPLVISIVQWDGTNLAEIESTFPDTTFTDGGDGTITYQSGTNPITGQPTIQTVATGQWLNSNNRSGVTTGPLTTDTNIYDGVQQQVASAGPLDYTVTEVTA